MDKLYTAAATATRGGRTGKVSTSDGKLDLELSIPKEMGGSGGEGTNPEQLFAAGYSACFESALGKELAEAAHQICPYSKATRGNIEVELKGMPS